MKYLKIAQNYYRVKVPPRLIATFLNYVASFLEKYTIKDSVGKALKKLSLLKEKSHLNRES